MFWDSSAIVPVLLDEERSPEMEKLLDSDAAATIWWATPVECWSAIQRRKREKAISSTGLAEGDQGLRDLLPFFRMIPATETVKARATKLLSKHPLRAADALQLAAALAWCEGRTEERDLQNAKDFAFCQCR